ncbi:MAG TPA: ABC transporter substrate-binding protein [Rubrivivax sp.]|nr:ABC transporter substrate-binding protein [Rubrivivax sp.]
MLLLVGGPACAQLLIGQPSGFTGSVAAGVKENTDGARLYIDAINARGGVGGQRVELISADDRFDPKVTAEVARDLIKRRGVIALFLNRGTPHAQALLPLLAEHRLPLVAPSTGAMALHEPMNPWVFNVRATYQREAIKAVEHLHGIGLSRIAVLQTDDSFGADAALGAMRGLAKVGLKAVLDLRFPRDKPEFRDLVAQVVQAQAQAVLVFGSAGNTALAVQTLRAAGSKAQVLTLSNNASQGFIKLLGPHAHGVIVTQVFPNERSISYPLINEAVKLAKAQGLSGVTPAMMEGFAAAKVLVEGLRRAGPNPTGQRLRDALEGLGDFDLGGMKLSYGSASRTGLDFADLSIIDATGRFRR